MRLEKARAELAKLRKELEFIDGQLDNDAILGGDLGLGELTDAERDRLLDKNEKLMTELIVLETMLEC